MVRAPARLDLLRRELDAYFEGSLMEFTVPLDRVLSAGFRRLVQEHLSTIPYGETVGTACATNPLPIVVPCHRVLRSDGTLGGYAGGLPAKSRLLDLERGVR